MNFKKESANVLVVGTGGREHALIWKIRQSPILKEVYTDNPNFAKFATYLEIDASDFVGLAFICKEREIDIVVVAQERYLADGIVDVLTAEGIKIFGPNKNAAKLESSKSFTKELCEMYDIPTAPYGYFTDKSTAKEYIRDLTPPIVIKANGLADGKGVFICKTNEEANDAIDKMLDGMLGNAGHSIIIEDFLVGEELSYFVILDGKNIFPLSSAKDYKQVIVNDKILNTGGMGAYSPAVIDNKAEKAIMRDIIYPTIQALSEIKITYSGILFAGIMLTSNGPMLLEYNVRLGDPEAQVILPRLESDFLELIIHAIDGDIKEKHISFKEQTAACLVIASKGYPSNYDKGFKIDNLDKVWAEIPEVITFNANIEYDPQGGMISSGGRVLNIVSLGDNMQKCRNETYKAAEMINWQHGFYLNNLFK